MKRQTFILLSAMLLVGGHGWAQEAPVSAEWELTDADPARNYTQVTLTLTNNSKDTIYGGQDWCIIYSLPALHPTHVDSAEIDEQIVQGTLHRLSPTAWFRPLAPGGSRSYELSYHRGVVLRHNVLPCMFTYLPLTGEKAAQAMEMPYRCKPLPEDKPHIWQATRMMTNTDSVPYANGENLYAYYQSLGDTTTQGIHLLPAPKKITYGQGECHLNLARTTETKDTTIAKEGYRIALKGKKITIAYGDEAGLYYAHQSLQQLKATGQNIVPNATIEDSPDWEYRGLLVDIARNYLPKEALMEIVETMAELKLNRLQLHLSDDEAWRLEIPSYPQLTEKGARRGYSGTRDNPLGETTCLYPCFDDGIENRGAPANGYLKREDMIALLREAKAHHIEVVPEVDMPGHMRAAKVALWPMLSDSAMDSRPYLSAQEYSDCVVDVTSPKVLEFVETVVADIQEMYKEAGCRLEVVNIGGDEVPKGALTREEHQKFIDAVGAMLERRGLRPAGWEEMARYSRPDETGWVVVWHHRPKLLAKLVEEGYKVVIGRNDHLYLDYSYANHEDEWGGHKVCDEFRAFNWLLEEGLSEQDGEAVQKAVVGAQANLWGETLRSVEQAETYLYPKLMGFAERAWNSHSKLTTAQVGEEIYRYLLPKYVREGHKVHVPMPGIHVDEEGWVRMCTPAQGAQIHYTTDGTEPGEGSPMYREPFRVEEGGQIRARAYYMGQGSCVVRW